LEGTGKEGKFGTARDPVKIRIRPDARGSSSSKATVDGDGEGRASGGIHKRPQSCEEDQTGAKIEKDQRGNDKEKSSGEGTVKPRPT